MTPSDMPIRQNFGTWNNFVIFCGFKPYKPYLSELAIKNKVLAKKGKRSSNWKGGKHIDRLGYVQVWRPDHPNARMAGYIHEHRLVMSEHLGRPLKKHENVHHINGKRSDNRLENLELWVTMQPSGQRPQDLVKFAKEILDEYENGQNPLQSEDYRIDRAKQAITSLINEAVKSYEDNLLSTLDDISNKPWRAARHIRELYENTDSGSSDWYKQVADDWGLLEEFFSNGGMGKVRELMADPNFNVNYPERIAELSLEEHKELK